MTQCSGCGSCTPRTARTGPTCRPPRTAPCALPPRTASPRCPKDDYEVVVFENRFPALAPRRPGSRRAGPGPTAPGAARYAAPLLAERPPARVAARWSATPLTMTRPSTSSSPSGSTWCWTLSSTAPPSLARSPEWSRCSVLRTGAARSASPSPTPTGRSTPTLSSRPDHSGARHRARPTGGSHGGNLFDDLLAAERADGSRLVLTTRLDGVRAPCRPLALRAALLPQRRASRTWPHWPARLGPSSPRCSTTSSAASRRLFDEPAPYIAGWHQAPAPAGEGRFRPPPRALHYPARQ